MLQSLAALVGWGWSWKFAGLCGCRQFGVCDRYARRLYSHVELGRFIQQPRFSLRGLRAFFSYGRAFVRGVKLHNVEAKDALPRAAGFCSMLVAGQGTFDHWSERESFTNTRSTGILQWW